MQMNPRREQDVFDCLVSADNHGRELFVSNFGSELRAIAESVALGFERAEPLRQLAVDDGHKVTAHCSAQIFLLMESCVLATKLLVGGHVNPAGNTMRVAYEALATAMLLAFDVKVKRGNDEGDYRSAFIRGDRWAWAYQSPKYIERHQPQVQLNDEGLRFLKGGIKFYNNYSHSTPVALAAKIGNVSHSPQIGGGYDLEMEEQVSWHLKFIMRFVRYLPDILQQITSRVTAEFREGSGKEGKSGA